MLDRYILYDICRALHFWLFSSYVNIRTIERSCPCADRAGRNLEEL